MIFNNLKKYFLVLITLIFLSSCGLILDYKTINNKKTYTVNSTIFLSDVIVGAALSVFTSLPLVSSGVYMFIPLSIDFIFGTLFYTEHQLEQKPRTITSVLFGDND